jgi:hypothetical protein
MRALLAALLVILTGSVGIGDTHEKIPKTDGDSVGGIGSPPGSLRDLPGKGRPGAKKPQGAKEAPNQKERPPRAPRKRGTRPKTVVLPHPGIYRAPAILRLAAQLYDLPVRVESKAINRIEIEIRAPLARRPFNVDDMRLFLAAHSLFLHVWDHPEKGELLIASQRRDWTPERVTYRKVLQLGKHEFEPTWASVKRSVEAHNARLPENARGIVVVPHPKTGKIFLWSPKRQWLDDLKAIPEKIAAKRDAGRPHLFSYKARHQLATSLERQLLEKLSDGEKNRVHLTIARWGNHVLFRTDRKLGVRVRALLEQLDRPTGP